MEDELATSRANARSLQQAKAVSDARIDELRAALEAAEQERSRLQASLDDQALLIVRLRQRASQPRDAAGSDRSG